MSVTTEEAWIELYIYMYTSLNLCMNLVNTNRFRINCELIIAIYIKHSPLLILDGVHLIFEQRLKGQKQDWFLYAKQESIWYHFLPIIGMTQSKIEPKTSKSRGKCSTIWPLLAWN